MEKIRKGDIAFCSLGTAGLITEAEPREVTYPDQTTGIAYVGIHLTDKIAPIGSPWSARRPIVMGHIDQPEDARPLPSFSSTAQTY